MVQCRKRHCTGHCICPRNIYYIENTVGNPNYCRFAQIPGSTLIIDVRQSGDKRLSTRQEARIVTNLFTDGNACWVTLLVL